MLREKLKNLCPSTEEAPDRPRNRQRRGRDESDTSSRPNIIGKSLSMVGTDGDAVVLQERVKAPCPGMRRFRNRGRIPAERTPAKRLAVIDVPTVAALFNRVREMRRAFGLRGQSIPKCHLPKQAVS